MFALDTNTLIDYFKGAGRVAEHFLAISPREIAIPSIVLYELESGLSKSPQSIQRRKALDELVELVQILPFDKSSAHAAATIRVHLEQAGTPIGPLDTLIAGISQAYGVTLVTHNTQEFSRVPRLSLIDWF